MGQEIDGRQFVFRKLKDFVIGCEREEDALRIMEVMLKRFKSAWFERTSGENGAGGLNKTGPKPP
jgi:hypothetical protein